MAPPAASEKTGFSGSSASLKGPPRSDRLLSPAGYVAVAVGLVITVVIVLRATASFQDGSGPASVPDGYDEVDLGPVNRELAPEAGGLVRESFMLKVSVVLNPKVRDLAGLKLQVERRRNLFRDIVWSEIINSKSDAELRKPAVLEAMKAEIRQRLNAELGGTRDTQEPIVRVIFPDRKLPECR